MEFSFLKSLRFSKIKSLREKYFEEFWRTLFRRNNRKAKDPRLSRIKKKRKERIPHQDLLASTTKAKREEQNLDYDKQNQNTRHSTPFLPKNTKQQCKQREKDSHDQTLNRTLQDHTRIPPKQNKQNHLSATNKSPLNTCYMNAENIENRRSKYGLNRFNLSETKQKNVIDYLKEI